jgi:hypothetical protein
MLKITSKCLHPFVEFLDACFLFFQHIQPSEFNNFFTFNFHPQHGRSQGLPLGVQLQGAGSAPAQGFVKEEIQGMEIRQFESFHTAPHDAFEVLPDTFNRYVLDEEGIELLPARDDPDVPRIPFVSGSGVCDIDETDVHCGTP